MLEEVSYVLEKKKIKKKNQTALVSCKKKVKLVCER